MNILISESGGPAAMGMIKSLWQTEGYGNIVTVDSNRLSAGNGFSDKSYVVPAADDSEFWPKIMEIIQNENIELIIPTSENDLQMFADSKEALEAMGVTLFMSNAHTIELCLNKWKFYNKCKDKFPLPKTYKGKFFKRPIHGKGSRGCEKLNVTNDDIISEYLSGKEWTIDVLCDLDSNVLSVVPRIRLETKAGISTKGQLIHNEFIENTCKSLCNFLSLKGPVCIQMKEDEDGIPHILEVNPRSGGGSYLATMAGVNFAEIIVKLVKGEEVKIEDFKEQTIVRYYEEVAI